MRVAFDARGHSIDGGGTFVYLQALSEAVGRLGVTMNPIFSDQRRTLKRRMGLGDWARCLKGRLGRRARYAGEIRDAEADLFCTVHHNYFADTGVPRVLHLQDLAYLRTDYYDPLKRVFWRRQLARALRDYEGLLAISESTRRDVAEAFDIDGSRIAVVPHGLHPAFTGRPLAAWNPSNPLSLLAVGVHHPRKRLPEAVALVAALRDAGIDARLRIVGPFSADTDRVREAVGRLGMEDRVELAGTVSFDSLVDSYAGADALIWTSAYEGFGFPLAEAMAMSLPLVSVTNSSVPEVTGGHYLEIDADDPPASARSLRDFLGAPERVRRQIEAAHDHARRYTWERAAQQTIEVWRTVRHAR